MILTRSNYRTSKYQKNNIHSETILWGGSYENGKTRFIEEFSVSVGTYYYGYHRYEKEGVFGILNSILKRVEVWHNGAYIKRWKYWEYVLSIAAGYMVEKYLL